MKGFFAFVAISALAAIAYGLARRGEEREEGRET